MKPQVPDGPSWTPEERVLRALQAFCRPVAMFAIVAFLLSVGYLLFAYVQAAGGAETNDTVVRLVGILTTVGVASAFVAAICVAAIFWGEEVMGAIMMLVGLFLLTSPFTIGLIQANDGVAVAGEAIGGVQRTGIPLTIIALGVIVAQVIGVLRFRAAVGAKERNLKLGMDVNEQHDIRNVFLGKCWQLPYCRKFVRERCPIYHSNRCCWKEQVGCMCEEAVIRNAMAGGPIPKDAVAAAKMIPRNTTLTARQKFERCKVCVIYNEHQKHKYKLGIGAVVGGTALIYLLFRGPLLQFTESMVNRVNSTIRDASMDAEAADTLRLVGYDRLLYEIVLAVCMFILMAYALKVVEALFFKFKL